MSADPQMSSFRYAKSVGSSQDEGHFSADYRQFRDILIEDQSSQETHRSYMRLLYRLLKCQSASLVLIGESGPHEIVKYTVSRTADSLSALFFDSLKVDSEGLQIVGDVVTQCSKTWPVWKHEVPNVLAFALKAIRIKSTKLCYLVVTDQCPRLWTEQAIQNLRDVAQMLATDLRS